MRLLFVADGRSPIAQNWIRGFVEQGHEVFLASTFPCKPDFELAGLELVPVAFSGGAGPRAAGGSRGGGRLIGLREALRHWLGPLTIRRVAARLRGMVRDVRPDLVHAMRIPFEGMLAADAYEDVPLVISVWGNDFTLHARANGLMEHYTSWAMQVADALHADCQRDIRLARQWGLRSGVPTLVIPGNGGVRLDVFHPPAAPVEQPVVLNPRGFRTYVRNDVFFRAIPHVLKHQPGARFICVGMQGEPQALRWIEELGIGRAVELLPALSPAGMADVMRRAQVMASISTHDGTPNTLLEGMASGCLPVAGSLESIREWIKDGSNGLLVDPNDALSVTGGLIRALENESLRQQAAGLNHQIIEQRAEYGRGIAAAAHFYERLMKTRTR